MGFRRPARVVFIGLSLLFATVTATAAEPALWLRYPAISPDGETIAFSYRGDLWKVPATGGQATQLTVHAAYEFMPAWSPDSSKIAFASDRYGTSDVFVMPADGGTATRLTYHSASDFPSSFTPNGESVLFFSGRLDAQKMVGYPRRGAQPELYSVALAGGMPQQILTTPAIYAVWDSIQSPKSDGKYPDTAKLVMFICYYWAQYVSPRAEMSGIRSLHKSSICKHIPATRRRCGDSP